MKALILALAVTTALPAFACKLDTPIDLRGLKFENGWERFTRADSVPDIRTLMSKDSSEFFNLPTEFALSKVQDSTANLRDGTLNPVVLGARVALGETIHGFGMSDFYEGFKMERNVEKTADGEIHTVKASSLTEETPGSWVYYLDDMSVLKIVNQQVVSVELTEGFFTCNRTTKKYDYSMKKTCVTEAAR